MEKISIMIYKKYNTQMKQGTDHMNQMYQISWFAKHNNRVAAEK
jgi:hypothetical protein